MWILLGAAAAMLLVVTGWAPARELFQLAPLSWAAAAWCVGGAVVLVGALELAKPLLRRPDGGTRG
jgi:hypothetical protein